ncbi:type IV secretion system DNA-binding domain-containing protein [Candidatus Peribacteria bacterium]|nr:MAG: type IV secretion system DNA-binding domain-containing protein [Candidatus Peribacteria bacterium]
MSSSKHNTVLLRIRPSLPTQDDISASRGPLMMETALSALHSLEDRDAEMSLEIGLADGKIGLFARSHGSAAALIESQLYGQFPDAEIEVAPTDLFDPKEGEVVVYADLSLVEPDLFPIKRYPQFSDLVSKQTIDSIAGITSTLVRYPKLGMRGHVQVAFEPIGEAYRKRALKMLPFLERGISKHWTAYAKLFAKVHLATGMERLLYFPLDMLMGGWKVWFGGFKSKTSVSLLTGADVEQEGTDDHLQISARTHDREDKMMGAADKLNRLLFKTNVRVSVIAPLSCKHEAVAKVQEIASSFRQFTLPHSNGFHMHEVHASAHLPTGLRSAPYVLSAEEIATLWHIPNILVKTPNIDWVTAKKLEPPVNMPIPNVTDPEENLTILGESVFHGRRTQFGIRPEDRARHMYVIGKTGMGKSTLLENMIYSDIYSGKGIGVIDPHGDLIEDILRFTPKHRSNDIILFDPADRDFPISFNMLECANPDQRSLICSGLMSVFTKLWPEAFSGRMEHILRNTLLALLENEGSSMLGILRMFGDDAYRAKIVSNITDPVVKSFWETEYAGWTDKYRTEAVAAIQNKIGQLLTTPLIRNIIGQVKSTLDVRHAMDTGKIVLVNLSKGKIGEDTAAFLGSMLVTKFQIDAMSRADIPEKQRRPFYLYVDEFQNFATKSFATILSEARKYKLALTMAHQYVGQLLIAGNDTALRDAVFGNVGSMVSFQIGSDDAEDLSLQFEEMVSAKDILSLPKYNAYIRLMIDGIPSKPFSLATLAPPKVEVDEERVQTLRDLSRERYAQKRAVVEEKILRWAATAGEAKIAAKTNEKAKEKEEEEIKKARAKKMSLADYRVWRDREMWTNEYNSVRKKQFLDEPVTEAELALMAELGAKLEASGGIPPPSKGMIDAKAKKDGTYVPKKKAEEGEAPAA